jgi:glycosyltransferase involved in cell wall biosynthesis
MTNLPFLGFDGFYLEQLNTGSGQYAANLWTQLQRRPERVKTALLSPPVAGRLHGKPRKLWWEQVGLVRATRQAGATLVHVPYFAAPLRQRVPHVVTVHDVIPLVLPVYGGSAQMRAYLRLVSRAVRKARVVITDSEHSRRDIARLLGIADERVRVTPLAVSDEYGPVATLADEVAVDAVRAKFGLTRPFVLNGFGFDARKRLEQLIRGYALALPDLEVDYDLVIAGAPHTGNTMLYPPVEPLIRELGLTDRVKLTGFVSEQEKRDLYRAASIFVFTSEYEGFGLTPLEAMACGAPVISSNRSSLPEVVGDAGILIDPEPEAIARAMRDALGNPDMRARLSASGLERAALFSWERTADMTLDAYDDVLGRAGALRPTEQPA